MLEPVKFRVFHEDGTVVEGRIELPDQIAIERNYDCSVLELFSERPAERIAYGAWHYLKRKKKIQETTEFDPWFNTVIEIKDGATDPDVFTPEANGDPKAKAKEAQPVSSL